MKIYVGNLGTEIDDAQLRTAFAAHGEVVSAEVVRDRETERSRGFGFVEMTRKEEGDAAIAALNGSTVGTQTIVVDAARPPARRDAVPGSGGRRGSTGRRW